MPGKRVSIILPALDEEEAVGKVIDEIPKKDMEERGYRDVGGRLRQAQWGLWQFVHRRKSASRVLNFH